MDILNNINENELSYFGKKHHKNYINSSPFPNIYFDNFFNDKFLSKVLDEFPNLEEIADYKFKNENEKKFATKGEYKLKENAKTFIRFLNSQPFLDFLSEITGINNLIPDPTLAGGGYHELKPGGFLKIHSDFNKHPDTKLDRRINVLIYLNMDWREEYDGHFELWNKEMTKCEKKILPIFNRMALFNTTSNSFHGNPSIVNCEEGNSRKSIAMYYYTNGRPEHEVIEYLESHSTIFKARKGKDNIKTTEAYSLNLINKRKKEKRLTFIYNLIRNITPPFFYNILRKLK